MESKEHIIEGKIETINIIRIALGISSVFYAGLVLVELFFLSLFLLVCGMILLIVQAVPEDKGVNE